MALNRYFKPLSFFLFAALQVPLAAIAQQQSMARIWSEQVRGAIRRDVARPPVHARNLFHTHAAMYDAWAAYDPDADPWLLGRTRGGYTCAFNGVPVPADPADRQAAREMAMAHACYRIITHRFQNSPGVGTTMAVINALMDSLGYDRLYTSTDYITGGPAALGNYIAQEYIAFGFSDGSNEGENYAHIHYQVFNPPIEMEEPGNPDIIDPNRWQQIALTNAIDQQGNPIQGIPPPVGHDWGHVVPFALDSSQKVVYTQGDAVFPVYLDPGPPAYIDTTDPSGLESFYKWNFLMVPIWQSHLDPNDETEWDISPGAMGNVAWYPTTVAEYQQFYDFYEGGTVGDGRPLNPVTGEPYAPQVVKRGDYARILAEFWADGPNSETPPGHWFEIFHHVMDHPLFERKWFGQGDALDPLEYDTKALFALGGALHDAAVTAWSIKGWYDYIRPVSAVRYMGDKGQCSDPALPNYHPAGMPIIPGLIEQVGSGDPLAGDNDEHVGKMKLYTWRGPDYIPDPETTYAGVGWILAENWWSYQRPSFVTPPFAGYISGHSTYSSSAAELLERITGSPYFPGGMGVFPCPANEFLEFEVGPSDYVELQWATYRDASDQCSLSRIWGGIHPPIDDIPGRVLGITIGGQAAELADRLISAARPLVTTVASSPYTMNATDIGATLHVDIVFDRPMDTGIMPVTIYLVEDPTAAALVQTAAEWTGPDTYRLSYVLQNVTVRLHDIHLRISDAVDTEGRSMNVQLRARPFIIDTERPQVLDVQVSTGLINNATAASGVWEAVVRFDEPCAMSVQPVVEFPLAPAMAGTLTYNPSASTWIDARRFAARFNVVDAEVELPPALLRVSGAQDLVGNTQVEHNEADAVRVDTRDPVLTALELSATLLNEQSVGANALVITVLFDEPLEQGTVPMLSFPEGSPVGTSLFANPAGTFWVNAQSYQWSFNLVNAQQEFFAVDVLLNGITDGAGNAPANALLPDLFTLDTRRPVVTAGTPSVSVVADAQVGPSGFTVEVVFDEAMDMATMPLVQLTGASGLNGTFSPALAASGWLDPVTYAARFNVADQNREEDALGITVAFARDAAGNPQTSFAAPGIFALDTRNPEVLLFTANTYNVGNNHVGEGGFVLAAVFDEAMDESSVPVIAFDPNGVLDGVLTPNPGLSGWLNSGTYRFSFDVAATTLQAGPFSASIGAGRDLAGNAMVALGSTDLFSVDLDAVGIQAWVTGNGMTLFPNPVVAGSPLLLRSADHLPDARWEVVDARGRLVATPARQGMQQGVNVLDVPPLAPGAYLLRIINAGQAHSRSFIILEQ